jgi:Putative beta-barrel porin 2
MKPRNPIIATDVRKNKNVPALLLKVALFSLLVFSHSSKAQQVIASPPPTATAESAWQQSETNQFQVFSPEGTIPFASENEPFKWGPFVARPHLFYQFLYGNGIQSSPGNEQDTVIQTVSPGILFDLGAHWTLDYTPTLRFYSSSHFQNEFDNAVALTGGTAYEDWVFGLSQSYTSSSDPQAQTGTQTGQENYLTGLTASYAFNSKVSLDMSANQNLTYVENSFVSTNATQSQNSYEWSTMEWLNYEFWARLNAGIGAGFGYVDEKAGPDQTYEQLQGRVNWRATDKISFQISAGFEDRQFSAAGFGDLVNPIFGVTIQYQPFEQTQISLNASRVTGTSDFYSLASVTETTSVGCNLRQRLLGKLSLDLGAGYSTIKYTESFGPFSESRVDDNYSFDTRLSYPFLKRGTVAVTYQYSDNSSTVAGFSYASSQIGFEIGYRY